MYISNKCTDSCVSFSTAWKWVGLRPSSVAVQWLCLLHTGDWGGGMVWYITVYRYCKKWLLLVGIWCTCTHLRWSQCIADNAPVQSVPINYNWIISLIKCTIHIKDTLQLHGTRYKHQYPMHSLSNNLSIMNLLHQAVCNSVPAFLLMQLWFKDCTDHVFQQWGAVAKWVWLHEGGHMSSLSHTLIHLANTVNSPPMLVGGVWSISENEYNRHA